MTVGGTMSLTTEGQGLGTSPPPGGSKLLRPTWPSQEPLGALTGWQMHSCPSPLLLQPAAYVKVQQSEAMAKADSSTNGMVCWWLREATGDVPQTAEW